ncbi:uncharacterized protein BO88DRAFT_479021 [Aspergillus vadensis CBS 113365]|uniref:Uncharacterized protein n=1 Tax=Aspergillus vadensis (strain CBS 113365 / IMI 142717 / IBT 24658) TaxID=1448311 RepID=A0A319CRR5_ASPVC|nr:hypothetical protein BO88DRAFT_479021 [Aspergillus vadensis CBS 113365]PYH70982.1 hypothetical protein BO88DRAFT_479021 [Aspergillus vadensis CBS 113365]
MTAPTQSHNALPDGFSVTTITLDLIPAEFKQFLRASQDVPGTKEYWSAPPTSILWLSCHPHNSYYDGNSNGKGWEAIERKHVATLIRAFKNIRTKFPTLQPVYGVIAIGVDLRLYRERMNTEDAAEDGKLAVEQFSFNEQNVFHDYKDVEIVKQWMSSIPLNFQPDPRLKSDLKELYGWDPIFIDLLGMSWLDSD